MGTRSKIISLESDKTVKAVYCHSDGYLSHNGMILNNVFFKKEHVNKLIEKKYFSSLPTTLDDLENSPISLHDEIELYSDLDSFFKDHLYNEDESTDIEHFYIFDQVNEVWYHVTPQKNVFEYLDKARPLNIALACDMNKDTISLLVSAAKKEPSKLKAGDKVLYTNVIKYKAVILNIDYKSGMACIQVTKTDTLIVPISKIEPDNT